MSVAIFYSRYVDIDIKAALNMDFPLRGESPFAVKGEILINEIGDFKCELTNRNGSQLDFLKLLYPLLTKEGIKKAIEFEAEDEPELCKKRLENNLANFHSEEMKNSDFENECQIDRNELKKDPLWFGNDGDQLHYAQVSSKGTPICRYSWKPNIRYELLYGIPRIFLQEKAKRLWFVEDPMQAVILSRRVSDSVYIRPNEAALQWNDYERLIAGKEVICLLGDDVGEFEYTSYPLINAVSSKAKKWINVYYSPLTGGLPFPKWLTLNKTNLDVLFQEVEAASEKTILTVTRQIYDSMISNELYQKLHFPQDVGGGMFWYGTVDGNLVHSVPVNRITAQDVLSKKNLRVEANTLNQIQLEGIRLTDSELMNILSSYGQFTPKRVYHHLKKLILRHVYFPDEYLASLVAIWIIGGYVHKLFPAFGYLRLNGMKDTGKTTLQKIITECGFNGMLQSQITKAGFAEIVHFLSCTLCLDEAEENSPSAKDDYVQLLKAGYDRDGNYSKMSGKSVNHLNLYSPKVIASIDPLGDDALDSRTLTIKTVRKPSNVTLEAWDMKVGDTSREVTIARRGCYTFGLWHHKAIQRFYRRIPAEITLPSGMTLDNRMRQIVAPLYAVAQLIDVNGPSDAENSLIKALDAICNPDFKEEQKSMKLFYEQLEKWGQQESFSNYSYKDGHIFIVNDEWVDTPLATHLDGKAKTLEWFDTLPGVIKKSTHIPSLKNSKGCTGFPLDLKIHKKTIQEIFRQ